jgi:lincosamide nucleotidyltransferase A/C/D/E
LPKLRQFLVSEGYKDVPQNDTRPENFVLGDYRGHLIDVHVIVLDEKGNGIYGPVEKGAMYSAASLTGSGVIDGHPVRCISAESMIKFHSGYELKEKDYQDISALCKKFGLELPAEYQVFIKQ